MGMPVLKNYMCSKYMSPSIKFYSRNGFSPYYCDRSHYISFGPRLKKKKYFRLG